MQASYTLKRPSLDSRVELRLTMSVRQLHQATAALRDGPEHTADDRLAGAALADVFAQIANSITDHLEDLETEVRVELEEAAKLAPLNYPVPDHPTIGLHLRGFEESR